MEIKLNITFCPNRMMTGHCWHQDPKPATPGGTAAGSHVVCCFCGTKEFHANTYYNEPPAHGQHRPVWS